MVCHGLCKRRHQEDNKQGRNNERESAPQSLAYEKAYEIDGYSIHSDHTFNFAIKVLIVWRNSPAVGCAVFCESRRFLSVENNL